MSINFTDEKTANSENGSYFNESLYNKVLPVLDSFPGQRTARNKADSIFTYVLQKEIPYTRILITGADSGVRNSFLEAFCNSLSLKLNVSREIFSFSVLKNPGDIISCLTNRNMGDVLGIKNVRSNKLDADMVLADVLSDDAIEIMLGNGTNANIVHLDLPQISCVISVNSITDISAELRNCMEFIITMNDFTYSERLDYIDDYAKIKGIVVPDPTKQALANEYETIIEIKSELNLLVARAILDGTIGT